MTTSYENLYAAAKGIMADVNTAVTQTITQAPSNYGTDFRIPNGEVMYQVQIAPAEKYHRGTVSYPRANVSIAIFHRRTSLTTEETFLHQTMHEAAVRFLDGTYWRAESGIFDLDPDVDPEVSEGSREGNVLIFEITATVLMTAV